MRILQFGTSAWSPPLKNFPPWGYVDPKQGSRVCKDPKDDIRQLEIHHGLAL